MYENEHKISITISAYLVDLSSSLVPTMTEFLRPVVLMVLLIICWIFLENSSSPSACPILRELQSAVCNPPSRTATRGEEVWLGVCVAAARITPQEYISNTSTENRRSYQDPRTQINNLWGFRTSENLFAILTSKIRKEIKSKLCI